MTPDAEARLDESISTDGDPPEGLTDLHSHLVPGVDDGAPTLDDALEGLGRMAERGVTSVATTPHLDASLTRDPPRLRDALDQMDDAFAALVEAASARHPGVRLVRAHEVKLDVPDPDLSEPRLRFPGTDVVLVEWPGLQVPPGTVQVLEELRRAGVRPLIAHPERYRLLEAYPALPAAWREAGAWLQVNHGSVVGRYGKQAERNAARLLGRGWVDVMATDFHGRPGLGLYLERARDWFDARGAADAWWRLAAVNPARILAGERPFPVPPVRRPETLMGRIRSAFGGSA